MRALFHLLGMTACSSCAWMLYWKAQGQDLNAFAREVLPIPILGTILISCLLTIIFSFTYRLFAKSWYEQWPRLLWILWITVTVSLGFFVTLSNS